MHKVYNFSAGPAVVPPEVLVTARQEMLDWHGSGMSVMEMSHRSPEFGQIIAEAEADLRALLAVPANYRLLFLQGGAHFLFSMLPLNLASTDSIIDLVNTGYWSMAALKEAQRFARVNVVASIKMASCPGIPEQSLWQRSKNAAYLHYVSNETIDGIAFPYIPEADAPLVCDMSSDILSQPLDVSRFGVIFAGAQKNIGPAGLTLAIVRDDLLGHARPDTPAMLNFKTHADTYSLFNTPPTFSIYMAGLVFKWLQHQGGLDAMAQHNNQKAALLYDAIDQSDGFYCSLVQGACRSRMNVPFRLSSSLLEHKFLLEAESNGLLQLKGHRSLGGMRASLYNAMPLSGVKALVSFMQDFMRRHG